MKKLEPERIYADTNILVSYAIGEEDKNYHKAKKLFDGVESGKYKIVISHFVLMEALHALRTLITRLRYQDLSNRLSQNQLITIANSKAFREKVHEESLKAFKTIVDLVTSDPEHFSLESDSMVYPGRVFSEGLKILTKNRGDFRVYRFRCRKCNNYLPCFLCNINSEISYKEANAPDMTHLFISQVLGCHHFFTMDKYIARIPKEDLPIHVQILEDP